MTITLSATRKREAAEALAASRLPDQRVLRRLPPTRYCAYASVLSPELVARCECWRCENKRAAVSLTRKCIGIRARLGNIIQPTDGLGSTLHEIDADIARMIDAIEAADLSASLVREVSDGQ